MRAATLTAFLGSLAFAPYGILVNADTIFFGLRESVNGNTDHVGWREGQDMCKDDLVFFISSENPCSMYFNFPKLIPGKTFLFKDCHFPAAVRDDPPTLHVRDDHQDDSQLRHVGTCVQDGRPHRCEGEFQGQKFLLRNEIFWRCDFQL
jgi:hypothetical protein